MIVDTDRLVSYNTYAKMRCATQQAVRYWADRKQIKAIKIDGRSFVILNDQELAKRREDFNNKHQLKLF